MPTRAPADSPVPTTHPADGGLAQYQDFLHGPDSSVAIYSTPNGGKDFILREIIHGHDQTAKTDDGLPVGSRVTEMPDYSGHFGLLQLLQRVWRNGGMDGRPVRRHQDGRLSVWLQDTAFRLPDGDVAVVTEDLTERKRCEHGLLQATQTLQVVMDGLPSFVYVSDIDTYEILFINRQTADRFGDVTGQVCWEALHNFSEGPCELCPRQKLLDESGNPTGVHLAEMHHASHSTWLEYRHQAIHWDCNQLVCLSIATDISERKGREQELRMVARAFDTTEGIMITEPDGTIVKVNRAFSQITGYGEQEILGANPRLLKSERNAPELYRELWQSLIESGSWSGELWNRHKNGTEFPLGVSISAIHTATGATTHYVAHFQDISERKRFQEQIEHQALYDALTDLPNRRLLLDRLENRLSEARRHGTPGSLMFLDLDNFKDYNDQLGHAAGDAILRETAKRIAGCVRREDTAARFGGDEFVVLLFHLGESPAAAHVHALEVAEKIRRRLVRPMRHEGKRIDIRTSIGIALFPQGEDELDDIIRRADQAMYQAKREGKNCIRLSAVGLRKEPA